MKRFKDDYTTIYDFSSFDKLIECPKCKQQAKTSYSYKRKKIYTRKKISCLHCGHNQIFSNKNKNYYHSEVIWLSIPCCGCILQACNEEHLAFLENFIKADLRERKQKIAIKKGYKGFHKEYLHWSNTSLFSNLPKWIKDKKNRKNLLKAIEVLKAK